MQIVISIDDTDNLDSRGTGELASIISKNIEKNAWGKCTVVTRHQLYIHPDIPYTSHNSSMCFIADIDENCYDSIIKFSADFLDKESAEGSDPGLCIAAIQKIKDIEKLIRFGKNAKIQIIKKQQALDLAAELGMHLSEHGGTGEGVIGALAGAALRLSGDDGRVKGKFYIQTDLDILSVEEILKLTGMDIVKTLDGIILADTELIRAEETVKAVLSDNKTAIMISGFSMDDQDRKIWKLCSKQQLKSF